MNNIDIIRGIMNEMGMNQREFSAYLGVSQRTVNTWMTGERQIPDYMVSLIERLTTYELYRLAEDEVTQPMMRWAVIDTDQMDEWITVCGTKADALREADWQWRHMGVQTQRQRKDFYVGLINVQYTGRKNRFEKFQQSELPDGSIDSTVYEEAKRWK